jgi:FHS family L-fucose permease-like MFS transporter
MDSDRAETSERARRLFPLLVGVYFAGGLITSMVSLLVPRLKLLLGLDYAQALSVHLAYYTSYLLFAAPIAVLTIRAGYLRAVTAGLAVMAIASLMLAAANGQRSFAGVLAALLALSSGVTFLQIAGNAVTTAIVPPERFAERLTLLQGFNSLGTVLGPLTGAWFLLGHYEGPVLPNIPFLASALALALLAFGFAGARHALPRLAAADAPALARLPVLLAAGRMRAGMAAIFVYVGAEVTIGTLAISYLMLPRSIGVSALAAGRLVSLYWAGAMIGRFAGAAMLRRIGAARLLLWAAGGAMLLVAGAIGLHGMGGAVAILAIGLCNSVMFPTIYALALPDGQEDTPLAAMLLCMAVVGGAIVPMVAGIVADAAGLATSLIVPGLCYLAIGGFALYRRP